MTLRFNVTLRNTRLAAFFTALDAGAGPAFFRIYDGVQPPTGGAATTLLAELTFNDPSAPAPSGGVATANSITDDPSANFGGTATWFRLVDSNGVHVADGTVGVSGSDLNLNTITIVLGARVSCTLFIITSGNP